MNFSVDAETRSKLTWGRSVLRALLDVPVNFSTTVRVAIRLYVDHLDQLLEQIRQARRQGFTPSVTDFSGTCEASHALIWERYCVRRANRGSGAGLSELPDGMLGHANDLSKYSELAEQERVKQRATQALPDLEDLSRECDPLAFMRDRCEEDI